MELTANVIVPDDTPAGLLRLDRPAEHELERMLREIPTRMSNLRSPPIPELMQYHSELPAYAEQLTAYLARLARWEARAEAALVVQIDDQESG